MEDTLEQKPNHSTGPRSTGPKTEAGKAISSRNSFKHGLTGRTVVLPGEDIELYLTQFQELAENLGAKTPVELKLAETIADGYWRLDRFRRVEEKMLNRCLAEPAGKGESTAETDNCTPYPHDAQGCGMPMVKDLANLSLYESRIQRGIEKAMKQLSELQTVLRAKEKTDMDEAIRQRKFDLMIDEAKAESQAPGDEIDPCTQVLRNLPATQFVFSTEEIDLEILRRDRRKAVSIAEKVGFDYQDYLERVA